MKRLLEVFGMNKTEEHGKSKFFRNLLTGILGIIIILALIGTLNKIKIIEVEQISHNASLDELWKLWDFDNRKEWDSSLDWIEANGPFELGQTGLLKLKEQPPRKFKITEFEKYKFYTDRFYLPLGGKMDWMHTLEQTENGIMVKWEVVVNGPSALMLLPIMRIMLKNELPKTVRKFIEIAEAKG
jgi:hypothetical protein